MSDSQTALAGTANFTSSPRRYELSDDLAKLCLPQEWKDSYRTLAWVNSICALFLLVGLVGLKAPRVITKPLSEIQDVVPIVFTPPEEKPPEPPNPEEQKPDDQPPPDTPTDIPQVATVVAVADPAQAAFPVPVQGAVTLASAAQIPTAPPRIAQQQTKPSAPTVFNPNAGGEGSFPPPDYPAAAQRNRYQGTVIIEIKVDVSGDITAASVFKSSGYTILDEAALQVVTRRWRFTPGKERWLHWPCQYRMQ